MQAYAQVSQVQAVQLMVVHQRYLQCLLELSHERQELMSLLSMNLHLASLGMHRDPKKGQSAAYQVIERLQSNVQRSRHAIANFVRECLVDVLNPVQVSLQPLSHQHLCIHHWSMSCNLALTQLLQHSQSFVSWVWILRFSS